ncbi:MAG: hypothetical protein IPJ75_02490 [Ignavibacteriales bacterium]|nr:hypothetical protein [Ignavibacteriales bacterium]
MALFTGGKKLDKLTQDNEKLTKEVAKLKQLHDKLSRENGELRLEKGNLLIDIETLRSQLNTFMEKYVDVEELERRAEELKNEIVGLEAATQISVPPGISLDEIAPALRFEIEELQSRKNVLDREITTKEAYLEKLNLQFDMLEKATMLTPEPAPDSGLDLAELNSEQESLQEIILDLRRAKMELEDEIATLQSAKSDLSGSKYGMSAQTFESIIPQTDNDELITLKLALEEKEHQVIELENRVLEELADKNLEINALKSQIEEKDKKISSMGLDGISFGDTSEPELPAYLTGEKETVVETQTTRAADESELNDLISQRDLQIENLQETIASLHLEIETLQAEIEQQTSAPVQESHEHEIMDHAIEPTIIRPELVTDLEDESVNEDFDHEPFAATEEPVMPEFPEGIDPAEAEEFMAQFNEEMEQVKLLTQEHENLQIENANLTARLSESESHLVEVNRNLKEVEEDNERLNSEVDKLLEELDTLKSDLPLQAEPVSASVSFDEKEKILSDYLSKREKLSAEISSLKSEADRLASLTKAQSEELNSVKEELEGLNDKKSEAMTQLQQFEEKKAMINKDLVSLEESRQSLTSDVESLSSNINNLESTSKVLEEKQLKTEELVLEALKSFNQEVVSLREQQTKLRSDILDKEREKSQKESEIERRDMELGDLKSEIKIAEKDLVNIKQHINSLKDEKDSLNKNLFELKDTEKRLNMIVQELKKNREGLKEENTELERKLNSMFNSFSKRHAELEERRNSIEENIKIKLSELRELEEKSETANISLSRLKTEIQNLENQKNDLVSSLERLKKIENEAHESNTEF